MVERTELNRHVDSENNHGGSSRTYVLHRTRCSQEVNQLLRKGCERPDSPGRQSWGDVLTTEELDEDSSSTLDSGYGSYDFHRLDLRSSAAPRSSGEGGASRSCCAPLQRLKRKMTKSWMSLSRDNVWLSSCAIGS